MTDVRVTATGQLGQATTDASGTSLANQGTPGNLAPQGGGLPVSIDFGTLFKEAAILTVANTVGGAAVGTLTASEGKKKDGAIKGAVIGATVLPLIYGIVSSARIAMMADGIPTSEAHKTVWKTAGLASVLGGLMWIVEMSLR